MDEEVIRDEQEKHKEKTKLSESKTKQWLKKLGYKNVIQFNTGPQKKPDLKIDIGNEYIFYLEVAVANKWQPDSRYPPLYPKTWKPRIEYRKTPYIIFQPLFFIQYRSDISIGVIYTSEWVEVENAIERMTYRGLEWFYETQQFENVNVDEEIQTGQIINRNQILLPNNKKRLKIISIYLIICS